MGFWDDINAEAGSTAVVEPPQESGFWNDIQAIASPPIDVPYPDMMDSYGLPATPDQSKALMNLQNPPALDAALAGIQGAETGIASKAPFVGQNILSPIDVAPNPNQGYPASGNLVGDIAQMAGEGVVGGLAGPAGLAAGAGGWQLERQAKERRIQQMRQTGEDPGVAGGFENLNPYDYATAVVAAALPSVLGKIGSTVASDAAKMVANGASPAVTGVRQAATVLGADALGTVPFTAAAHKASNPDAPLSDLVKPENAGEFGQNAALSLVLGALGHGLPILTGANAHDMAGAGAAHAIENANPDPAAIDAYQRERDIEQLTGRKPTELIQPDALNRETIPAQPAVDANTPENSGLEAVPTEEHKIEEQAAPTQETPASVVFKTMAEAKNAADEAPAETVIAEQPDKTYTVTPKPPDERQVTPLEEKGQEHGQEVPAVQPVEQPIESPVAGATAAPETPVLDTKSYVDAYLRGQGRGDTPADLELQQFAVNNGSEIEKEFAQRHADSVATEKSRLMAKGIPEPKAERQAAAKFPEAPDIEISHAATEAERARLGLEERPKPERVSDVQSLADAKSFAESNPNAAPKLVSDLNADPTKVLKRGEAYLVKFERARRDTAYEDAAKAYRDAAPEDRKSLYDDMENKRMLARESISASERAGSEQGAAFRERQIANAKEELSLARRELDYEASKPPVKGEKSPGLTPEEHGMISEHHAKIQELQNRISELESKVADTPAQDVVDRLISETKASNATGRKAGKTRLERLKEQRDESMRVLRSKFSQLSANAPIDPELWLHAIRVGAYHIADGAVKIGEFAKRVVADIGDKIRPHVDQLFEESQKYHDSEADVAKPTAKERAAENAAKGEKAKGNDIYEMARERIAANPEAYNGEPGFNKLMEEVHGDITQIHPDMTLREMKDTFSDYGKTKFPSTKEDLAKLRDFRRMAQIQSAIEDAENKKQPLKSGMQRDKPSDYVKRMMKELNAIMKRNGLTAGGKKALRTPQEVANARFKTWSKNRLAEQERKIANIKNLTAKGEKYVPPAKKEPIKYPPELEAKRAELQRANNEWETALELNRIATRPVRETIAQAVPRLIRAVFFGNPLVMAKLISASVANIARSGVAEQTARPWAHLFPDLADSSRYGHYVKGAYSKSVIDAVKSFPKSAMEIAKAGMTDRELVYGDKKDTVQHQTLPEKVIYRMHGIGKALAFDQEFNLSFAKSLDSLSRQGVDLRSPEGQVAIELAKVKAAADGANAKYQGENAPTKARRAYIGTLKREGALTLATASESVQPVYRVGMNLTIDGLRSAFGVGTGLAEIAGRSAEAKGGIRNFNMSLKRAFDGMKPAQKDVIMKNLAHGSIGPAALALGWFGYKSIKPYYDASLAKKNEDKKNPNNWEAIDTAYGTIGKLFTHAPWLQLLFVGSTLQNVSEDRLNKKDEQPRGMGDAAMSAGIGFAEQNTPGVGNALALGRISDPYQRTEELKREANNYLVPQIIQKTTRWKPFQPKEKAPAKASHRMIGGAF